MGVRPTPACVSAPTAARSAIQQLFWQHSGAPQPSATPSSLKHHPACTSPPPLACRHLTPACIKHVAALTALTSLRLEHTGLILAHPQLQLLGSCPRLAELSLDSLDLCALRQQEERQLALAAAAVAEGAPAEQRAGVGVAAAGWPPLVRVHLHSTSSYLNLRSLLGAAGRLRHLTLMHYVRWDEGELRVDRTFDPRLAGSLVIGASCDAPRLGCPTGCLLMVVSMILSAVFQLIPSSSPVA